MADTPANRRLIHAGEILPPETGATGEAPGRPVLTPAGAAALAAAQALAKQATSSATLRAYKADWTHFSEWCAAHGFVPVPAAPATVGAYLASLQDSHESMQSRGVRSVFGRVWAHGTRVSGCQSWCGG